MSTGERIKAARNKAGLKQSELAEKLGVAVITIGQYERGKRQPRLEQLQAIAAALDVSVNYLLGLTPEEQDTLQYIENYVAEHTGQDREAVRMALMDEKISAIPYDTYNRAIDAVDAAIVEDFRGITDSQLRKYMLDNYLMLNRRGRIEAVIRTGELADNSRFNSNGAGERPHEDEESASEDK